MLKKTIITNLKSNYKLIIAFLICLTCYALYELYYPKKYFYSCYGKAYLKISAITSDPNNPKEIINREFINKKDNLIVSKYFYGIFYTLDDMKISECFKNSLEDIICYSDSGNDKSMRFNPYKNTYNETRSYLNEKNNEKNEYSTSYNGMKCDKNKSSLN